MKQPKRLLCMISSAALLALSCAGSGPVPASKALALPEAKAAPAKVAKQRTVVTKVPVLVKESSFYSDGLADEYFVYTLDPAKKNLLEKDSFDAARPDPVQRSIFEYKDGRLAAESIYESDGRLRSRRELSYGPAGLPAMERNLDSKGKAQSSSTYAYDASGRKTEWRVLDASGSLKALTLYSYGGDGLELATMKDSAEKVSGTIKLEYSDGKLAKRSYFGADGSLQKSEVYAYSEGLQSSIERRRADGSLESKTSFSYGPMGELLKSVESDSSGKAGAYSTYEYAVREDSAVETYYE
jgi:antitoxin component YwqK of YwqJK toxin-antitoxin module